MKLCYLHGGEQVPTVRFRKPFFELLRERGHHCNLFPSHPSRYESYSSLGWRLSRAVQHVSRQIDAYRIEFGRYDSAIIETGLFHSNDISHERRIRRACKRLVYEIDDAVFLLFPDKVKEIVKMSDHVIAANEALAEWIRNQNASVSIIPTCVDVREYQPKIYSPPDANHLPVIGWIGSRGNVSMLNVCAEALRELSKSRAFQLRVITSDKEALREVDLEDVNVQWIDVNRCDTVEQLHRFDIGIMPLPANDPWMTYKCNAKMIQYMSVGLPAVGSAIGFNRELVNHGVDGFLAADTADWIQWLTQLIDSHELRQSTGMAARSKATKSYTIQSRIQEYEHAVFHA
jgi:glycosyltransferase involved in cell wall biosynthesis